MASSTALMDAVRRLLHALQRAIDPSNPPDVAATLTGAVARLVAILSMLDKWNSLRPQSPAYDAVIAALDAATAALEAAKNPQELRDALTLVHVAIGLLEELLNNPPPL